MDLTTLLLLDGDDEEGFCLLDDDDGHHTLPETKPIPSQPPPQLQGFDIPQKLHISSGFAVATAGNFSLDARDDNVDSESQQATATKRRDGVKEEEPGDDVGEYFSNFNSGASQDNKKRGRGGASSSGAESLDDRAGWSKEAIGTLLDAYIEQVEQLGRRNFKRRDWEAMAATVAKQHPARDTGDSKNMVQCKYKIYNLMRRYKAERRKIADGGNASSNWPWFKKMEFISGTRRYISSPKPASSTSDEKPRLQQQQNNESGTPSRAGLLSIGALESKMEEGALEDWGQFVSRGIFGEC